MVGILFLIKIRWITYIMKKITTYEIIGIIIVHTVNTNRLVLILLRCP